jgi:hypothetical protein
MIVSSSHTVPPAGSRPTAQSVYAGEFPGICVCESNVAGSLVAWRRMNDLCPSGLVPVSRDLAMISALLASECSFRHKKCKNFRLCHAFRAVAAELNYHDRGSYGWH